MSISSEERRRTEAALVRAIDVDPDATSPQTRAAVAAYIDVLLDEELPPEAAVIAFKATLTRADSLHQLDAEAREQIRARLVSACIDRYFAARLDDEVRVARTASLRLVREEESAPDRRPEASA